MNAEARVAEAFLVDHAAEAARMLERARPADAATLLGSVPAGVAAEVLRVMAPSPAAACAAALTDEALAAIVDALPLDAAGAALRRIEPARRGPVLDHVAEERRDPLRAVLAYPENTAGALADPLVLSLAEDMTVAEALRQLRRSRLHLSGPLYVVARDRLLVGVLPLPDLLAARAQQTLAALMQREFTRLDAHADLATVAVHPAWHDVDALPVTDSAGRLIGALSHRMVRRLSQPQDRPVMSALVGLSELYWAGLSGILAGLAGQRVQAEAPPPRAEEG